MRSEFQDVFKDAYDHWIDDACSHRYNASKSLALQVWQHQQSKVDELQKRVDELQTAFKQLIEMENESISFEHDLFDKGWNQSARQTIENIYKLTGLGEQALRGGES